MPHESAEEEDDPRNLYESLRELFAKQAGHVPPAKLHAAIAASFEAQHQEYDSARAADGVNQVLLERAMEASVGSPIYNDAER
jgi:hypothetical protein